MPTRLLAVVDATERSRRVLDYVIGYAASVGPVEAVVLNIRADSNGDPNAPLGITDGPSFGGAGKRIIKSATRRLNRLGIVHKSRVEAGDPVPTILRCAHEERCDIIILNDSQIEHLLDEPPQARNGREESVSEEVSKLTSVPVVIPR
jgi:nucleotide-binding universal stress UspA family protein